MASCDVLIALIGRQWLTSTDAAGQRRLGDPEDLVRREIATALRRNIRVIPVLIQDMSMPRVANLPDDLQPLTRRNALELSDAHLHRDVDQLIVVLDRVLEVPPSPSAPAETGPPARPVPSPVVISMVLEILRTRVSHLRLRGLHRGTLYRPAGKSASVLITSATGNRSATTALRYITKPAAPTPDVEVTAASFDRGERT